MLYVLFMEVLMTDSSCWEKKKQKTFLYEGQMKELFFSFLFLPLLPLVLVLVQNTLCCFLQHFSGFTTIAIGKQHLLPAKQNFTSASCFLSSVSCQHTTWRCFLLLLAVSVKTNYIFSSYPFPLLAAFSSHSSVSRCAWQHQQN